ncbi:HAD family hydrolase [Rhodococcus rhodnii]|uniref:HAD family hydrolase n=1 Tax=Rhodococcus rhodnii TaxID=38312 RepID=A0A6P2CDL7_9NOCA|nr:HAD family hydrolase [Rhodococcus rhodnii]TXG89346.1 HAD family hydrolase [Rhodococcus rhodnii]
MSESDTAAPRAVLFDIDGTLVDSNYLHVETWTRAFFDVGHPVDAWRVHRSIGMDGDRLLAQLLPSQSDDVRERAKELHLRYHLDAADRMRVLPGARELLADLAGRGIAVVLASSASEDEIAVLRRVLDVDDLIAAATSSASVETAKPEPDIVAVALSQVNVAAENAVLVGDAVYDMGAATRAGVTAIGVLSGGIGADELVATGAAAVFDDAADLLAHLDESPIRKLVQ